LVRFEQTRRREDLDNIFRLVHHHGTCGFLLPRLKRWPMRARR
jgi:hypothetical protein